MQRNASAKVQQSGSHNHPAPGSPSHDRKAESQQPSPSVHPVEPEDAYLTGTSRSLQRRVLGLNVDDNQDSDSPGQPGHQAEEHPDTPAGQHATGSFTDKKRKRA